MLSISISFGGAEGKTVHPAEGRALQFTDAEPLYSFFCRYCYPRKYCLFLLLLQAYFKIVFISCGERGIQMISLFILVSDLQQ